MDCPMTSATASSLCRPWTRTASLLRCRLCGGCRGSTWNSFARKNVGYVYAMFLGAELVLDLDDDNILKPRVSVADTIVSAARWGRLAHA